MNSKNWSKEKAHEYYISNKEKIRKRKRYLYSKKKKEKINERIHD